MTWGLYWRSHPTYSSLMGGPRTHPCKAIRYLPAALPRLYQNKSLPLYCRLFILGNEHGCTSSSPIHSTWCPKSTDALWMCNISSPRINSSVILVMNTQVVSGCCLRFKVTKASFKISSQIYTRYTQPGGAARSMGHKAAAIRGQEEQNPKT